MSRWRTARTPSGGVIPSGLDPRPRGAMAPLTPKLGKYRAVVINTYVTDDTENRRKIGVECDVILVLSQLPLHRVPVMQRQHGVNDLHDAWVPRETSRLVTTGESVSFDGRSAPAAKFGDLDGDHVLIEFIEGDMDKPIIVGAFSHEQTKRKIIGVRGNASAGRGWREGGTASDYRGIPARDEFYVSHRGVEHRVGGKGDVLFDTVGAHDDIVNESPNADGGAFRIRMKSSKRFTVEMDGTDVLEVWKDGAQVRIDLGEGATQRIPLGDDLVSALKGFFDDTPNGFTAWIEVLRLAVGLAGGTLDNSTMTAAIATLKTKLDASLSDLAKVKKT